MKLLSLGYTKLKWMKYFKPIEKKNVQHYWKCILCETSTQKDLSKFLGINNVEKKFISAFTGLFMNATAI